MAETLKFELVSPERMLASKEAAAVVIPGQMGEITAMPGHSLFFTTLRPGYVTVDGGAGGRYFVTGGFAEISPETLSVLAEEAVEAEVVTADWLRGKMADVQKLLDEAGEDRRTALAQTVNDYAFLAERA
ncbi:F0F1 ATP synthase subunit epsilon [Paralimibaculum aggregatum]|uniref:ATP synthase epsilon chain n=1 Tax=Paralimibaculum aggregatum TaxID=3036245 RepID=A0ABQ6LGR5_9RHOB|nr:ATP synthase F1 subunit epsilon [Limibaculum sp. NKW23]GMG82485.1 F0F1 ATP synthase subunit epsilon [Limibaculum sp. NKW23]